MAEEKNYTFREAFADIESYISQFKSGQDRVPVLYLANYQSVQDLQIIELNKLTMLFGPNSSGKSVVVDALQDLADALRGHGIDHNNKNWHMNREETEFPDLMPATVIGIGGVSSAPYADSVPMNLEFIKEEEHYIKFSKIFHNGVADIVFCDRGSGWNLFYWNNNEHVARFSDLYPPIIYSKDNKFVDFIEDAEDWHNFEDHFSDSKKNIGYIKNISWLFAAEDEIDPEDWAHDGIERATEVDELDTEFHCPYKFMGNPGYDWTEKLAIGQPAIAEINDSPYGSLMHFFLMGIVNAVRNLIVNSSSLGPLRAIPNEEKLYFRQVLKRDDSNKTEKSIIWRDGEKVTNEVDKDSLRESVEMICMKAAGISQKSIGALTPHDGATYWRFLAEQLVNSVSDETYPHQLLGVINKWLSDKFDSGYVIDNDIELELDPLSFDKLDAQSKVMDHPYWLNVKLSLKDTQTKNRTYPHAVGVGISQLIPVLIAMIVEQRLYIEQPELHLHPKLQLVVSDIAVSRLNKMREEKNCWLLAETHSEHMILRLLRRVAETNSDIKHRDYWLSKDEVTVYYVKNDGGGAVFHKLRITDDGDFEDDWPDGFFEDRDSELFY